MNNFIFHLSLIPGRDHDVPPVKRFFESSQEAFDYGCKMIDKHLNQMYKPYEEIIFINKIDKKRCSRYLEMFLESDEKDYKEKVQEMAYR